jgi:hypothetical protein
LIEQALPVLNDMVASPLNLFETANGALDPAAFYRYGPSHEKGQYQQKLRYNLMNAIGHMDGIDPAAITDDYPPQSGYVPQGDRQMNPQQFGLDKPPQFGPDMGGGHMGAGGPPPGMPQGGSPPMLSQLQEGGYEDEKDKVIAMLLQELMQRDDGMDPAAMMDDYPPQSGYAPMPDQHGAMDRVMRAFDQLDSRREGGEQGTDWSPLYSDLLEQHSHLASMLPGGRSGTSYRQGYEDSGLPMSRMMDEPKAHNIKDRLDEYDWQEGDSRSPAHAATDMLRNYEMNDVGMDPSALQDDIREGYTGQNDPSWGLPPAIRNQLFEWGILPNGTEMDRYPGQTEPSPPLIEAMEENWERGGKLGYPPPGGYPPQSGSSPMPQDITSILNIAVKLLGLAAQMGYGQEPDMMPDHQQQRPPVYDREPYDENEMQYQAERSYPR